MDTCPGCAAPLGEDGRCAACAIDEAGVKTQVRPSRAGPGADGDTERSVPGVSSEPIAGRYRISKKLGSGSFGEVFAAFDEVLERTIALKRIRLDHLADGKELADLRARSIREAQVAAKLRHPNIVAIHDVIATDSECLIVMELIEGETLDQILRRSGRMSLTETREILAQLASALDYAHQHKVVHRDIKPANIMLDDSGRVQVMDFGVAKAESSGQLTATGLVVGTPNYMSPEQARGESLNGRSDIFSMACIFYECLAGSRPFGGTSVTATLLKIVSDPPPPLDYPGLGVDPSLGTVVEKGLAKDRDQRFETASAFIEAIDAVANDRRVAATTLVSEPRRKASEGTSEELSTASGLRSERQTSPTSLGTIRHVYEPRRPGRRRLAWALVVGLAVLAMLVVRGRIRSSRVDPPRVVASEPEKEASSFQAIPVDGHAVEKVAEEAPVERVRAGDEQAEADEPDDARLTEPSSTGASPSPPNGGAPLDDTTDAPQSVDPPAPPEPEVTAPEPEPRPVNEDSPETRPTPFRRDRRGEAVVIQALRRLHARQAAFHARHGTYASGSDAEKLKGRRTERGVRGAQRRNNEWTTAGYHFRIDASSTAYQVLAVPTPAVPAGSRSFYIDQTGVLRGADHAGLPASATDPPIPHDGAASR